MVTRLRVQTAVLTGIPAARIKRIEGIVAASRKLRTRAPRALLEQFLQHYFRGVAEEDLEARPVEQLLTTALAHFELGRNRRNHQSLVALSSDETRTYVAIVTGDMPFLVDSLGMVFAKSGIAVHLIVHPVFAICRNRTGLLQKLLATADLDATRESWQLFEIDREVGADKLASLREQLLETLADVRSAVSDWPVMRARVQELSESLQTPPAGVDPREASEARALLDWMAARHFVFLGYRDYQLERGAKEDKLHPVPKSGLGILRSRRGRQNHAPAVLRGEMRRSARDRELLVLTKANTLATVHRLTYLDYVAVKCFGTHGEVIGERRFLGLWTSAAYHDTPRNIPVLRLKVEQVIAHFGLDPQSHDGKSVLNVLETYPRDELFQARVEDLIRIVRGVVNLYERRTVRLLARRDPYGRFYSCFIYVPRDRYNTEVRRRIERIVTDGFAGVSAESQVQISDSNHARLHVIVRLDEDAPHQTNLQAIEAKIAAAASTWSDALAGALAARQNPDAQALHARYQLAFPLAYQEDIEPADALGDLGDLEALRASPLTMRLNLYRPNGQKPHRLHLKISKLGDPIPISDILPMLENFDLRVIAERPYELQWPEGGGAWIQDFELEHRDPAQIDIARIESLFKEAFAAAWAGSIENDGFNRLVIAAGLNAREVTILRAYCRYLLQTGIPFSQASMERVLVANFAIARHLVRLFQTLFDPGARRGSDRQAELHVAAIRDTLDAVASVDDDRILRAYLAAILATLRTNYYQTDVNGGPKQTLAFKLDPERVPDLPLPRPKFEIFVYSVRVEGVHLRKGYVARGGIRWSDRREDFRTEVLGLMKAQNVKNTVIVPVGAKGGFVPKRLPVGTRDEVQREVIAAYQMFIAALLELTDNLAGDRIVAPTNVVRRDGDDAYLVVAADKGTASFSDIANTISLDRGFWLGDAFASGGSAGYDHKKMAITARGAWECVKRHFRELRTDIQSQDFTVSGIGDMSGDVFGNGLLLSRHIVLQAAFNHQHVFIDPAPDAVASFKERERLFALPRSGWNDYNLRVLSRGGGIYLRSAKSIALSREAQTLLGLAAQSTPDEVIRAILKMPVDLLWNGGIGTYVKSSDESHADVGDRTNNSVRINGAELRARVIGEGGNLGLSQRGRIEYALRGGRLNTDFIDNSAGVNTSDVEVNIKILLNPLVASKKLTYKERNRLLTRMTREVSALVLRNNYLQSQALSTLQLHAASRLLEYQHLIRSLERSGDLNRAVEYLPTDEELAERRKAGLGLTRPELAIVLSYSKIWLNHLLIDSDVPEDPYLSAELVRYFPEPLRERFARPIAQHRLRREIIATATTNSLINRMGPMFMLRAQEETGAAAAEVARAYTAAREIFEMRDVWAQIEALDNRVAAADQYDMMSRTSRLLRHLTYWLLAQRRKGLQVDAAVTEFRAGVRDLVGHIGSILTGAGKTRFDALAERFRAAGAPQGLADGMAGLEPLNAALDIVVLAAQFKTTVVEAARCYFLAGERIGLDWMQEQIEQLSVEGPWQAAARSSLRDSAAVLHRRIAERVLSRTERSAEHRVESWVAAAGDALGASQRMLNEIRAAGSADFATLTVGVESMRKLADR